MEQPKGIAIVQRVVVPSMIRHDPHERMDQSESIVSESAPLRAYADDNVHYSNVLCVTHVSIINMAI
jgi:hypothetical protein